MTRLAARLALLAVLLARIVRGATGRLLALQLIVFGLIYPCLAGLDPDRQRLYQNLCFVALLAFAAWLAARSIKLPSVRAA